MNLSKPITQRLNSIQQVAIIVAVVGLVLGAIGAFIDVDHWFQIYLVSFVFWLELALGCLGLLMIINLVGSRWGFTVQRIMAAGARTIPLLAILFIPVLFGLPRLYSWAASRPETFTYGEDYWFVPTFFVIRVIVYFVIWSALAYLITNLLYRIDKEGAGENDKLLIRAQRWSAGGLVLFVLTTGFAYTDWLIAVDSHWFSSVYGWIGLARQAIMAFALGIIVLSFVWREKPLLNVVNQRVVIDLGTLLHASLLTWIYLSFMQYFIMWSANLPFEVFWYADRTEGTWFGYLLFLVIIHAAVLLALFVPGFKRTRGAVLVAAIFLAVFRLFEIFWLVMPAYMDNFFLRWWDIALPIGLGGLWAAIFIGLYKSQNILPLRNPGAQKFVDEPVESYQPAAGD